MSYRQGENPEGHDQPFSGARLVIQQGPELGQEFRLSRDDSFMVGRAPDCDIVLDDPQISRHHARFFWRGPQLVIEDLGSANGVLVNGIPVSGPQILSPGDQLQMGPSTLEVRELRGKRVDRESTLVAPRRPVAVPPGPAAPPPASRGSSLWPSLIGLGIVLGGTLLVLIFVAIWYTNRPVVAGPPVVTIITPANGAELEVGAPMTVQVTAVDGKGVTRLELRVDGALVDQQSSPSPQGQSPLLVNFSWSPLVAGSHVLEVQAYNVDNLQSVPAAVTVRANPAVAAATPTLAAAATPTLAAAATATTASLQPPDTPTPAPTATFTVTPLPTATPTETPVPKPGLQSVAVVNVRTGPGTNYPIIGQLQVGDTTEVVGRNGDGYWWQIIYPPHSDTLGWVTAALVQVNQQAANVPVVAAPPPPATSTPVPTPTSPSAEISFKADDINLDQGECTKLRWRVKNVAAYWVDDKPGVGDEGSRQVCDSPGTTTHVLRVQRTDGSTQEFTVTITVEGQTVSKPKLISPENNKEFNHFPREATFVWSSVSAAGNITYNIQIQYNDGSWHNWKVVTGLADPTYTMNNFVGANPGRWRVWATSSTLGDGDKTDWRKFEFLQ